MAQLARAIKQEPMLYRVALPAALEPISLLTPAGDHADSPARRLHELLVETFEVASIRTERKLPFGARLALIAVAALLPWMAIGGIMWSVLD